MSKVDDLYTQAMALPMLERAALAQQLLHSLEPEEPDAEEAWAGEIQARSDALHRGEFTVHDWREALDGIRKQLHK
jgi:putative addiction module component (TIGR02574 family)